MSFGKCQFSSGIYISSSQTYKMMIIHATYSKMDKFKSHSKVSHAMTYVFDWLIMFKSINFDDFVSLKKMSF